MERPTMLGTGQGFGLFVRNVRKYSEGVNSDSLRLKLDLSLVLIVAEIKSELREFEILL